MTNEYKIEETTSIGWWHVTVATEHGVYLLCKTPTKAIAEAIINSINTAATRRI